MTPPVWVIHKAERVSGKLLASPGNNAHPGSFSGLSTSQLLVVVCHLLVVSVVEGFRRDVSGDEERGLEFRALGLESCKDVGCEIGSMSVGRGTAAATMQSRWNMAVISPKNRGTFGALRSDYRVVRRS